MKTAEETAIELYRISNDTNIEYAQETWRHMDIDIKKQWLRLAEYGMKRYTDARISSLEEAAEIAEQKSNYHLDGMEGADWKEFVTEEAYHVQASNIRNAILSLATKLKEGTTQKE